MATNLEIIDQFSTYMLQTEVDLLELQMTSKSLELPGQIRQHKRNMDKWFQLVTPANPPKKNGIIAAISRMLG